MTFTSNGPTGQLEGNTTENNQSTVVESQANPQDKSQEETSIFLKVGDRVFKTQEDAINHINHAQSHISKLEKDFESATGLIDRQAELLEKARKVDEVMEAMNAQQNSTGNGEETPGLSKDEVIADAIRAFEQRQQESRQQETVERNWNEVVTTLTQAYGDKVDEVVQKVAADNGLSVEDAAGMAQRHPKVFLKMFDLRTNATAKPNQSSVNASQVASTPSQSEYKSLRRMSMKERAAEVERRIQELQSK